MAEPVSLDEAKAHLRVTSASEDDLIQGYLEAAVQHVEEYTGLVLETREVVERLGNGSRLRSWPVRSIVAIVQRGLGAADAVLAPASYALENAERPARVMFTREAGLAATFGRGVLEVTVAAGYNSPAEVPASVRQAVLLLVGHFYSFREAVTTATAVQEVPLSIASLLRSHRVRRV